MSKKNKHKQQVFNPPTRYPQNLMGEMQRARAALNAQRTKDTNDTFNLITSTVLVVLKEIFEFSSEQLNDVVDKVLEQLELMGDELVNIDQIMTLCASYGLNVEKTNDKMDDIGKLMQDKIKVYELLDQGVTEIDDLSKRAGISSRAASGLRWLWNKEKFGKDYEGDMEMKTKRELCFELFDKGLNIKATVENTDLMENTVKTYYAAWKKETLAMLSTEESASYFAGEKELWEVKQEKIRGGAKSEVMAEISKSEESVQKENIATKEVVTNEQVKPQRPKGLRKRIVVDGEFAQYKPSGDDLVDIEIYGQVITVTKDEMLLLIEEFGQIANDADMWKGAM